MVCWWLLGSFAGKFTSIVTLSKSISSSAQYVTLQKYFSHPSIVLLTFLEPHPRYWNSDNKQVGGTTNSKPLGPIIMMGQSETLRSCQIMFITHFPTGAHCCCAIYQRYCKLCNYVEPKLFSWAEPGICLLFFLQFYCAGSHTEHSWRCTKNNNMHANCKPTLCQHINPSSVKHPQHYHQKWENVVAFESTWMRQCSSKL
jgi:hypothetical protein